MPGNVLEQDCRAALQQLQGALVDLYAAVGAEPGAPQAVAREFGLNKNLTWKVSKILMAEDALATVPHLPGGPGVEILLRTFEGTGAPQELIRRVRDAVDSFDSVVERHAGDRAGLDLMLDGLGMNSSGVPLDVSRELAFRGNSGVWGLQARVRVMTGCITPNRADPTKVDSAVVAGFLGLRCLRPGVVWPLFKFERFEKAGAAPDQRQDTTLEGEPISSGSMLIRSMGSLRPDSIEEQRSGNVVEYSIRGDIVGNTGAFDTYFGRIGRGLPGVRSEPHQTGAIASIMPVPVETLIFDLIVHRDVRMSSLRTAVYAMPSIGSSGPGHLRDEYLLPLQERFVEISGRPPVLATPLSPAHSDLIQLIYQKMGFEPRDFRAWRLQIAYPPVGSFVVARWDLPEA